MSLTNDAIAKAFNEYKSQGLTYYEATQKLQQAGYSKQEIIDVAYYHKYTDADLGEHPTETNRALDATFAEAVSKQRSVNRLEDEMNMDMIKRHQPLGTFWGIKSIFSWANFISAKHTMPKSKVYLAYIFAVMGFTLLSYISVTVLMAADLPVFFMIICIVLSLFFTQYCLSRYLNSR